MIWPPVVASSRSLRRGPVLRAWSRTRSTPYADAAIAANATANDAVIERELADLLDGNVDADVVLAGDVFYSGAMAERMLAFMRRAAAVGASVVVGDPGRAYAPQDQETLAMYDVPVIRDLEDADFKHVRILNII